MTKTVAMETDKAGGLAEVERELAHDARARAQLDEILAWVEGESQDEDLHEVEREDFEADRLGWRLRAEQGIRGEALARPDLEALDPALGPRYQFGYRLGGHAHITDPGRYVKDLAAWFAAQGGGLLDALAVVEPDDGQVLHVVEELEERDAQHDGLHEQDRVGPEGDAREHDQQLQDAARPAAARPRRSCRTG